MLFSDTLVHFVNINQVRNLKTVVRIEAYVALIVFPLEREFLSEFSV